MTVSVDLRGVFDLEDYLTDFPERTRTAASQAINRVLKGSGLAEYRKGVAEQINLPPSYLKSDRLAVTQVSTPTRLEGRITGRHRATSLARFVTAGTVGGKGGVSVRVKAGGGSSRMKSAFLVRLKAGTILSEDSFNVGLALRLKPGQTVIGKRDTTNMVHLDANVVLLYGPSIEQVLRTDVADKSTPAVVDDIVTEFYRNFQRLAGR